jgi:hypothetical protein
MTIGGSGLRIDHAEKLTAIVPLGLLVPASGALRGEKPSPMQAFLARLYLRLGRGTSKRIAAPARRHSGFHAAAKIATVALQPCCREPGCANLVWQMKKIHILTTAAIVLVLTSASATAAEAAGLAQYAQLKTAGAKDLESLDMSAVPELDRGQIRRVQTALRAKGFDPGSVNGVINAQTKSAVVKFQDRFGIKATGMINNQTLFALGVVGDSGPTVEEEKESKQTPSKPRRETKTPAKSKSIQRSIEAGSRGPTRWCAAYQNGSQNCGFSTLDQCRASISGVGGTCIPN